MLFICSNFSFLTSVWGLTFFFIDNHWLEAVLGKIARTALEN